jgi:hypothetical protein
MPSVDQFGVFLDQGEDREPLYITSWRQIEDAKAAMDRIAAQSPGSYFIWNSLMGTVVARVNVLSSKG